MSVDVVLSTDEGRGAAVSWLSKYSVCVGCKAVAAKAWCAGSSCRRSGHVKVESSGN